MANEYSAPRVSVHVLGPGRLGVETTVNASVEGSSETVECRVIVEASEDQSVSDVQLMALRRARAILDKLIED